MKLTQIEKSANRAAELTGQLLAFSRRHPTVLDVFNLNGLVSETMDMIRSTVPSSIDVRFLPEPGVPNIEADSTQIQQILINLILNARDALHGNSDAQITISTRTTLRTAALALGLLFFSLLLWEMSHVLLVFFAAVLGDFFA